MQITCQKKPELITFSGGVASCFEEIGELFRYGDIGVLLAQSIRENPIFQKGNVCKAKETMRATVIGAGNYSMNISGSTIEYTAGYVSTEKYSGCKDCSGTARGYCRS